MTPAAAPGLVAASVFHGRRGRTRNAFRYGADYLLLDVTGLQRIPLTARNRAGILSLHDRDYGDGRSGLADYARRRRRELGLDGVCDGDVLLLTQARRFGFLFNPVSFWFFRDGAGRIRALLAEVTNVDRDRHSYLCAHPDLRPIAPGDDIRLRKAFHVSPFQPVDGAYTVRARLDGGAVSVAIRYVSDSDDGLLARLDGTIRPATRARVLAGFLRRPLGSLRVVALIYWQALKLKAKGAAFRRRPPPPVEDVSR